MNDFTEETLTKNFPIQMISDGSNPFQPTVAKVGIGIPNVVWTISIDGQEVSRITRPIITNSGREAVMKTLLSEPQWGGFLTRSTIEDLPLNPLYMELFE